MPSVSKKMRRATAIAEHHPEMLYDRNKDMAKMSHEQLHDFASTSEKGLPQRVRSSVEYSRRKPHGGFSTVRRKK